MGKDADLATMTTDDPAGDDEHEKSESADVEQVGEADAPCRERACHGDSGPTAAESPEQAPGEGAARF